jgi:hypothetical protein
MKRIGDPDEAIDVLGGTAQVARLLQVGDNVVSNWRTRGFPPRRFVEIGGLLKQRGYDAAPAMFGLNPAKRTR